MVEEGNLNRHISTLRKTLGESPNEHEYIVTVPGRGYRFVAKVRETPEERSESRPGYRFVANVIERPEAGFRQATPTSGFPLWSHLQRRTTLAGVGLLCLIFVLSIGLAIRRKQIPDLDSVAQHIHSVAVLPLQNLSGDPGQDYFSDGLTEALTTDLAQIHALHVVSRTSAMRYKGTTKPLSQIAADLNVDAVIEGSVLQSAGRTRITVQLIQAKTDKHLWANTYEGDARDVLGLQSMLARAVVQEIRVTLTPEEQTRLTTVRLIDPEAHEAYLKGRYLWNQRTPESSKKSVAYFQQAVQKDPQYAAAYLALGEAYALLAGNDIEAPEKVVPKAKEAAHRALELDGGLGEAYGTLAHLAFMYDWDFPGAEQEFRRALDLSPNCATAHQWYGILLMAEKRFDEAAREFATALAIDPLSLMTSSDLGQVYFYSGRLDKAIEQTRKILEINPAFAPAHDLQAMAYEQQGNYEQAMAEFQKYFELSDGGNDAKMHLAHLYAVTGRGTEARRLLSELESPPKGQFASPYDVASIYAALGENEKAFRWLEQAYKERATMMPMASIDPLFNPLRTDSRFQRLLRRVGLPQ
jgi:TolB-like protein/tetratricopeptide (TPR) repeat protein